MWGREAGCEGRLLACRSLRRKGRCVWQKVRGGLSGRGCRGSAAGGRANFSCSSLRLGGCEQSQFIVSAAGKKAVSPSECGLVRERWYLVWVPLPGSPRGRSRREEGWPGLVGPWLGESPAPPGTAGSTRSRLLTHSVQVLLASV